MTILQSTSQIAGKWTPIDNSSKYVSIAGKWTPTDMIILQSTSQMAGKWAPLCYSRLEWRKLSFLCKLVLPSHKCHWYVPILKIIILYSYRGNFCLPHRLIRAASSLNNLSCFCIHCVDHTIPWSYPSTSSMKYSTEVSAIFFHCFTLSPRDVLDRKSQSIEFLSSSECF